MSIMQHVTVVASAAIFLGAFLAGHPKTLGGGATDPAQTTLPTPRYAATDSDPPWLRYAAQFHGHLGPWATAGLRLGAAGRQAIGAEGYFDVRVTCQGPFEQPPKSCFLDGLQVATGATLGKRNLEWAKSEAVLVRIENTRTGKTATVKPTKHLLELLVSIRSRLQATEDDHDQADADRSHHVAESLARQIVDAPIAKLCELHVDSAGPE